MAHTIGNPLSWGARRLAEAGGVLATYTAALGGQGTALPKVRTLTVQDVRRALRLGLDDFMALRTDIVFLCLFYPVIGALMVWFAMDRDLMPLIFPMLSGFALIGPVAAVGLYEISRRRERGEPVVWADAFAVVGNPRFGAVVVLGLALFVLFLGWLAASAAIYAATMGPQPPAALRSFVHDVFTTDPGQTLIFVGLLVGLVFAALVLVLSIVSFPLLLDRDVGIPVAIVTSVRVSAANPGITTLWGLIVAGGLVLGCLPALLGLAVVLPVLGHATWHLYRRAVI